VISIWALIGVVGLVVAVILWGFAAAAKVVRDEKDRD